MKSFFRENWKWLVPLYSAVLFTCGVGIGIVLFQRFQPPYLAPQALRESGYRYTAPILLCNIDPNRDANNNKELQSKLKTYTNKTPENTVSVYFLELRSGGTWAGVNEQETYDPASMLKVPTMTAVLKYVDSHRDFLNKEVYYDGSFDDSKAQYFKPQKLIQAGHSYTIDELLTYAIAYSDNNAERLLDQSFEPSTLNNIFLNLGIQIPAQPQDFMTTETYAEFLRLLYNSTYLSPEMSDKALGLMAQPDFPQGLEAGIPQSVQVAQKFGERQVLTPNGMLLYRELHDCGIVYAQNDPYVLCVMTRGQDFNVLASIIANVSKISYDYVDANRAH